MNLVIKTFSKLSLAMLVLLSAAFFVLPAKEEVKAQGINPEKPVYVCVNTSKTGTFQYAYKATAASSPVCPASPWASYTGKASDKGLCAGTNPPIQTKKPSDTGVVVNDSGTTCTYTVKEPNGEETKYIYNFVSFASITQQYTPAGTSPNTTPNTNPTNPTNTKNPGTGTGGTTQTPPTGGCEGGFHKVGPLCVPNSPFNNGDSITSETTVGGLAARIVKILLYFAGIVAVIMAIVGGYQVMTAGGNAAQATGGKKTLVNAIIGLVIVILSYIIIQAVLGFVTK